MVNESDEAFFGGSVSEVLHARYFVKFDGDVYLDTQFLWYEIIKIGFIANAVSNCLYRSPPYVLLALIIVRILSGP